MRQNGRRASYNKRGSLGSFDSAISDVSLLDDDELLQSSFPATSSEVKPNINKKTASAAPPRGLIINGLCFSLTTVLGVICIGVAYFNDPPGKNREHALQDEDCAEQWEMWLYVYGIWIVFLQILSAVSLVCQRTGVQPKQSSCCAKRRGVCGRILFIVIQFLQLPLLAWIAYGCMIFWRYPFNCESDACPGQLFQNSDDPPEAYNVSSVHIIPPRSTVTKPTTMSTVTRLPNLLVNSTSSAYSSGQSSEAWSSAWHDACIQEHKFGWVLLLFVVVLTLCSWALTVLILVCSYIARRQQKAAAYDAQTNLDAINTLIFNDEQVVLKYSPQPPSGKHQVTDYDAWRMM